MVGKDGYISLTDFGLSKKLIGRQRTNSFCGTPNHFSPEIVNRKEYSFEVDIWSFGVFIYELLVGRCPFTGVSAKDLFNKITSNETENHIEFPLCVSENAKDLISKILTKSDKRLSIKEIKEHPFYNDINWENILNKAERAPFTPRVADEEDTKYFYSFDNDSNQIKRKGDKWDSTFVLENCDDILGCFSFESCSNYVEFKQP